MIHKTIKMIPLETTAFLMLADGKSTLYINNEKFDVVADDMIMICNYHNGQYQDRFILCSVSLSFVNKIYIEKLTELIYDKWGLLDG